MRWLCLSRLYSPEALIRYSLQRRSRPKYSLVFPPARSKPPVNSTCEYNDSARRHWKRRSHRITLNTVNDVLLAVCKKPRERVILQRQVSGWVPLSSAQIYRSIVGVAHTLESWGIGHGERVAILNENRSKVADYRLRGARAGRGYGSDLFHANLGADLLYPQ